MKMMLNSICDRKKAILSYELDFSDWNFEKQIYKSLKNVLVILDLQSSSSTSSSKSS